MKTLLLPFVAAAAIVASPVKAENEDALYGASVPADAIFVRQIGVNAPTLDLFGEQVATDRFPDSVYVALSAESLPDSEIGSYYTVLGHPDGQLLIDEPDRDDQRKVYLFLLNASESAAQLAVAGGGPVVLDNIEAGEMLGRPVNPVSATLAVSNSTHESSFDVALRRKVHLTFLVTDEGVTLIEDSFGPVIAELSQ